MPDIDPRDRFAYPMNSIDDFVKYKYICISDQNF